MPTGTPSRTLDLTRPGIIEASAGTGKTFTVAEIFLALLRGEKTYSTEKKSDEPAIDISEKTFPRVREILVVTFTEAATAELRKRLREKIREAIGDADKNALAPEVRTALRLADEEFDEAAICTIHGFCMRVLKEFGLATSRLNNVLSSSGDELSRFTSRWRAKKIAEGNTDFFHVDAGTLRSVLSKRIERQDIVPVKPAADNDSEATRALFLAATEAFAEWEKQRASARDISYAEILTTVRDELRASHALAKKIATRFRYAFVDEFQDTDPVQWEIFKRIFLENNRPIFCVGDPKQAIFEFRGGDVRTYRTAREDLKKAGNGNALTLGENWRSEPETIAAFNEIFAFDKKVFPKISAGSGKDKKSISPSFHDFLEYQPTAFPQAKSDEDSGVPAIVLKVADPETNKDSAQKIIFSQLVEDIADLVKNRGVPAQDIAVLVSENKDATELRARLAEQKIPVSTTARGNILCEPCAQDFAELLRAMLSPRDTPRLRRVLLSPFFAGTQNELLSFDENDAEISEKFERVQADFVAAHERWQRAGFLPAFAELAGNYKFFQNIATLPNPRPLFANIFHLLEKIHATEQNGKLSPRALVDTFSSMIAAAKPADDSEDLQLRADSDEPAVSILTVHKSKGLEFKIVFLPTLWDKDLLSLKLPAFAKKNNADGTTEMIFDSRGRSKKSEEFLSACLDTELANSACNFYVALTRARSRVVIYHALKSPSSTSLPWDSYQKHILREAGFFDIENPTENALPHWKKIPLSDKLPETIFPKGKNSAGAKKNSGESSDGSDFLSDSSANKRFADAEKTLEKLRRNTEGVFSFSSLMRTVETEDFSRDDEPTEADDSTEKSSARTAEKSAVPEENPAFPQTEFFALPAGKDFGTLVHLIFEKTNFRARENLDELLDGYVSLLPNDEKEPIPERKSKLKKMVEGCLTLPLTEKKFRLESLAETDFSREMEFQFPLKRSRTIYENLAEVFRAWGGIYAETAERLWHDAKSSSAPKLNIAGMMLGVIDLAFKADGKFYILDWKTNQITKEKTLSHAELREEIVVHGYALQWSIYALALRKFLQKSLGENYVHDRDFGGIVYLFVRWLAPFFDAGTLTNAHLDELSKVLVSE